MPKKFIFSQMFVRIFAASFGATFMVIVISLAFTSFSYEKQILRQAGLTHDVVAKRMALEMGLFFEQSIFQLQLATEMIKDTHPPADKLHSALNDIVRVTPHFLEIVVSDLRGKEYTSSEPRETDRNEGIKKIARYKASEREKWISDVMLNENRAPYIIISIPMVNFDKSEGCLYAKLSLKKLWWWIDQINSQSDTFLSIANSRNGVIVADESKALIGRVHPLWFEKTSDGLVSTPTGKKHVSFHSVPNIALTIVTQSKQESFMQHLYKTRFQLFGFGLGLVSFSILIAVIFSARTTSPVISLVNAINEYARSGQLHIPPKLGGEYKMVAEAVAGMTISIDDKQKSLVQQESLVVVGRMASSLAHELRHGLHLILNMIYFLKESDTETKNMLRSTVQEMSTKISDIMEFARSGHLHAEAVDSMTLMYNALETVKYSEAAQRTNIIMDDQVNFQLMADQTKMTSALSNLMRNAMEAGCATLWVSARVEGTSAIFEVRDDGPGIKSETLEKIFEPFFSTKRNGFGIGLSIVESVSKAHGGESALIYTGKGGTLFRMTFPLVTPVEPEPFIMEEAVAAAGEEKSHEG